MIIDILNKIGICNFRDKNYLEKVINSCDDNQISYEKIAEVMERDVSTVRKRISKILSPVSNEKIEKHLNLKEEKMTKKKILEGIMNASKDI